MSLHTGFTSIVGFDSAWTDNPKAPGAICVIRLDGDGAHLYLAPRLASFAEALDVIERERKEAQKCLVALDQPTIVPNLTGSRPVDRVAGSLISWIGGGVQPASRSKKGMFDDGAPIWRFKQTLAATEEPELARAASSGLFLIEVFPALALAAIEGTFCSRLAAPKVQSCQPEALQDQRLAGSRRSGQAVRHAELAAAPRRMVLDSGKLRGAEEGGPGQGRRIDLRPDRAALACRSA